MSEEENALSFEELTGAASQEEWNETTLDNEFAKISDTALKMQELQKVIGSLEEELKQKKELLRVVE